MSLYCANVTRVGLVQLNRPKALNALCGPLMDELMQGRGRTGFNIHIKWEEKTIKKSAFKVVNNFKLFQILWISFQKHFVSAVAAFDNNPNVGAIVITGSEKASVQVFKINIYFLKDLTDYRFFWSLYTLVYTGCSLNIVFSPRILLFLASTRLLLVVQKIASQ